MTLAQTKAAHDHCSGGCWQKLQAAYLLSELTALQDSKDPSLPRSESEMKGILVVKAIKDYIETENLPCCGKHHLEPDV